MVLIQPYRGFFGEEFEECLERIETKGCRLEEGKWGKGDQTRTRPGGRSNRILAQLNEGQGRITF